MQQLTEGLKEAPPVEKFCRFISVGLPLKKLWLLSDRYCIEYVIYHTLSIEFRSLGDAFLIQQYCSQTKYQEDCDTVCWILRNPVLYLLQVMICKNQQFQVYIYDYRRSEFKIEMQKLIANICLKKPVIDISSEIFERFFVYRWIGSIKKTPFLFDLYCMHVWIARTAFLLIQI